MLPPSQESEARQNGLNNGDSGSITEVKSSNKRCEGQANQQIATQCKHIDRECTTRNSQKEQRDCTHSMPHSDAQKQAPDAL